MLMILVGHRGGAADAHDAGFVWVGHGAGAADAHDAGFVRGLATGQLTLMTFALYAAWPLRGQLMLVVVAFNAGDAF